MDLTNDTAVVGGYRELETGMLQFVVHAYRRGAGDRFTLEQVVAVGTPVRFADPRPITLHGDTFAVGMPGEQAVYVFERSDGEWNETAMLTPGHVALGFGRAIDLWGDRLVVGAPSKRVDDLNDVGAAYLFERTGGVWAPALELHRPARESGLAYGTAVAVHEDAVVIGAPGYTIAGARAGAVFGFEPSSSGWLFRALVTAPTGQRGSGFGRALALSRWPRHHYILAVNGYNRGGTSNLHLYHGPMWWLAHRQVLHGGDLTFGSRVAFSETTLATVRNAGDPLRAEVLIYPYDGGMWMHLGTLSHVSGHGDRLVQPAIALSPEFLLVGSPRGSADPLAPRSGVAHVLRWTSRSATPTTFVELQRLEPAL